MSSKVDEPVLVVPSAELDRLGRFQGFSAEANRYMTALLRAGADAIRPRSEVEDDPGYKQIIPYVVFRCTTWCSAISVGNLKGRPAAPTTFTSAWAGTFPKKTLTGVRI